MTPKKEQVIVDIDFLKSKLIERNQGWGAGVHLVRASSGNSHQISKNVFAFTEYNFLPVDGSELDGHYQFFVNYKTFDWLVRQNSYYGSLTYVTEAREKGWKEPNDIDKAIIESTIAYKLLGMYYWEYDAVNGNGPNLFSTGEKEKAGGGYRDSIVRYNDGIKLSLISSTKFELKDHEKEAIKLLEQ